jgi:hypothetical protein
MTRLFWAQYLISMGATLTASVVRLVTAILTLLTIPSALVYRGS